MHERGAKNVSCAVPTTRCNSFPRAAKGTIARENAASLLSSEITLTVFAWKRDLSIGFKTEFRIIMTDIHRVNDADT